MDIDECNKIIAEYEFDDVWMEDGLIEWEYGEGRYNHAKKLYTESLDSLVSVWEKMNHCQKELYPRIINKKKRDISFYKVSFFEYGKYSFVEHEGNSLKEVAAIATAKAIQELGNE